MEKFVVLLQLVPVLFSDQLVDVRDLLLARDGAAVVVNQAAAEVHVAHPEGVVELAAKVKAFVAQARTLHNARHVLSGGGVTVGKRGHRHATVAKGGAAADAEDDSKMSCSTAWASVIS